MNARDLRVRLRYGFFLLLFALVVFEGIQWRHFEMLVQSDLERRAEEMASAISGRLMRHFERVEFIANGLLALVFDWDRPPDLMLAMALREFAGLHRLVTINVLSSDGKRVWWSMSGEHEEGPVTIFRPGDFSSVEGRERWQLSPLRLSSRLGEEVVGARVPVVDPINDEVWWVGVPLRGSELFAPFEGWRWEGKDYPPYAFEVFDSRRSSMVARWDPATGLILFSDHAPAESPRRTWKASRSASALADPFVVVFSRVRPLWGDFAAYSALRWGVEGVVVGLLGVLFWQTWRFAATRDRLSAQLSEALSQQERLARTDPLTGLANRRGFVERSLQIFSEAHARGCYVAVGLIDLDDFKPINDRFGHPVGDRYLKVFAARLVAAIRQSDLAARLGGDEFAVVLGCVDQRGFRDEIEQVMNRFAQVLTMPIPVTEEGASPEEVMPLFSVGWAIFPEHGEDPDQLLRAADEALLRCKSQKSLAGRSRGPLWAICGDVCDAIEYLSTRTRDPFSERARELLQHYRDYLLLFPTVYGEEFFRWLEQSEAGVPIYGLSAEEQSTLRQRGEVFLGLLLCPLLEPAVLSEQAQALGREVALRGFSSLPLTVFLASFADRVQERLTAAALRGTEVQQVGQVVRGRAMAALSAALEGLERTRHRYQEALTAPLPSQEEPFAVWSEVEAKRLATLPGIGFVAFFRPDAVGRFVPLVLVGEGDLTPLRQMLSGPEAPRLGSEEQNDPLHQDYLTRAWLSGRTQICDDFEHDPAGQHWAAIGSQMGIRSLAVVPVVGGDAIAALVVLGGAYPKQFSFEAMRQFIGALRLRLEEVWRLRSNRTRLLAVEVDEVTAIRTAVLQGKVTIAVQPIVRLEDGQISHVEALARLVVGERVLSPGQFLPLLRREENDALFRVVLREALSWRARWESSGYPLTVSVNIDPATFAHPLFEKWVAETLSETDTPAEGLMLELLEHEMGEAQSHEELVARLRAQGVQFAIDDLGSGYSSLLRLVRMPLQVVKIDQGITRALVAEPLTSIVVMRMVARLCEGLERISVAEGLETKSMVDVASILGAGYGQGYALARPMPAEDLPVWLREFKGPYWYPHVPISSALAALAYQWQAMHERRRNEGIPLEECPVTVWLQQYYPTAQQAQEWHRAIHLLPPGPERRNAAAAFKAWLLERAAEENRPSS
ncbi:MAG: EAL domain-containing protein [Hydrogenophilus sp.]|nr:EAL domain-containing protein [Hydrogenophilus sp.]